jgi:nicotinamide mononucleotide adenylyltransferase
MHSEDQLFRLLAKVRALRARAGTPGERRAAAEAEERLLARLRDTQRAQPVMHRFSIGDPWSQELFFALLDREGLQPIRYPRQQWRTVRVRAPRERMDPLWSEFRRLQRDLLDEIREVARRSIRTMVRP